MSMLSLSRLRYCTWLALPIAPLAQAASEATLLPSVEVTAQRLAVEERKATVAPKIILDGEELSRYGKGSLGDALRRMPGFYFGGAPGENKDLRLRGLDKEYAQVLVDGRRLPDSGEKREVQLDQIPLAMVDRIELIRSPDATMDAQGIGGTLNIIMKKRSVDERSVIVGYATGDSRPDDGSLQFTWGQVNDNVDWLIGGGRQSRTTPKSKDKNTWTATGAFNGSEYEQESKRVFENFLTPHLGWSPTADDRFSLDLLLLDSRLDKTKLKDKFDKKNLFNGSEEETEHSDKRNFGFDLGWQHALSEDWQLDSYLNWRLLDEQKDKDKLTYSKTRVLTKTELEQEDKRDREVQFGQSVVHWLDGHELIAGYDSGVKKRDKDKAKTSNGASSSESKDNYQLRENRFDLYVSDTWQINPEHTLQPGLRWEQAWQESRLPNVDAADERYSHVAPSLHYRWAFADDWALRSSVARTVRRPKFDDILPTETSKSGTFDDPNQIGNPALEAEKSWSYDLGVDRYLGQLDGVVGVNLFYRDIQDLMEEVTFFDASQGEYFKQTQNTGDGKLWGAEFDFNSDLAWLGLQGWRANAGYSWLDSEVQDKTTGLTRRFKQQPGYLANAGLEYRFNSLPLTLGGSWNAVGGYEDELASNESKLLDRVEYFDLFAMAELGDDVTLRLAAENLGAAVKQEDKTSYNSNGTVKASERSEEFSEPLYSASVEVRW